jgi:hypothetical protein
MTAANSTTYQWDAANRLKSVNNGSLGSYGYDGNGKRGKRKSEGGMLSVELSAETEGEQGEQMLLFRGGLQLVRIKAEFAQFGGLVGGTDGVFLRTGRFCDSTSIPFSGREQELFGVRIIEPQSCFCMHQFQP